jgi:hypothetical protein
VGHVADLTWQTLTTPDFDWLEGLTPVQFFERHIEARGDFGCWLWTGRMDRGYGRMNADGATHAAYRVSYVIHRGSIPAGLHLDHLCRVQACVNPWHLDPVTQSVNTKRSLAYRRAGWRSGYMQP